MSRHRAPRLLLLQTVTPHDPRADRGLELGLVFRVAAHVGNTVGMELTGGTATLTGRQQTHLRRLLPQEHELRRRVRTRERQVNGVYVES